MKKRVPPFPAGKKSRKKFITSTQTCWHLSGGSDRGPSGNMSLNQSQSLDSASSKLAKRKNSSFIDLIFGPKRKRSRTGVEASVDCKMPNDNTKGDGASAKKTKPSLEKSRKKEVKARLNDEASKEIRSLAVGTLAMMASALANQGR